MLCGLTGLSAPQQQSLPTSTSVPGMTRYDDDSGFSFWYPASWSVTRQPITNCAGMPPPSVCPEGARSWLQQGRIIKQLRVGNSHTGILLQVFDSPSRSILELGFTESASPVGQDIRYFFDTTTRRWMQTISSGARVPQTAPADVSQMTMGGLPLLAGAKRHGVDSIVPLSQSRFIVIESLDISNPDQRYLAKTIVLADPRAAIRADLSKQLETIDAWRAHSEQIPAQ